MKRFSAIFFVLISVCSAQKWQPKIPNLILDTLVVPLAVDSLDISDFPEVPDTRKEGGYGTFGAVSVSSYWLNQ